MITQTYHSINTHTLLSWYQAIGVDEAIDATPSQIKPEVQDVAITEAPSINTKTNIVSSNPITKPNASAPTAYIAAKIQATSLAQSANNIQELEQALRSFDGCALKNTAMNTVFADGNPNARLMIIGEAPSADDDKSSIPLSGANGKLLDTMLSFAGLTRANDAIVTNMIYWRPPGNRQPTIEEIEVCRPFIEKHIALANPNHILLLGGTVSKALLGDSRGITKLRGNQFMMKNTHLSDAIPTYVTYHPNYLLHQPLAKREAWLDILSFVATQKAIS